MKSKDGYDVRVLHFYKTHYPDTVGGTQQVIHQIACAGVSFGIVTQVLSLSTQVSSPLIEHRDGYKTHRIPTTFELASTPFSLQALKYFKSLVNEVDVVHYHYPWPFMDLMHLLGSIKKPSIVTYHSDIIRQNHLLRLYQPLQRYFLNRVDVIVATSPNYLKTSETLAAYQEKSVVIPIGLDKASYPKPSLSLLHHWQEKIKGRFFLFVGALRYYKGLHILLHALKEQSYPVVIVGSGYIETELKNIAAQLGLENIYFLGTIPDEDKVALLTLCYAVVFPSHLRSEAFGVTLLEGAMYGKPMISCDIGTGTSFVNLHEETGLVVAPNDPKAFSDAMTWLWEHPERAKEMGVRAEQRYWAHFTAKHMAQEYARIYQQVMG